MPPLLDLSLEELAARSDWFGAAMEEQFHLPAKELDPLHADEHWVLAEQPDAKRLEQVVTHLQVLGYLPSRKQEHFTAAEVAAAHERWAADYAAAIDAGHITLHFDAAERRRLAQLPAEERLLRELKALATFEGEVVLQQLPAAGETGLAARLVHLRLRTFGLARVTGVNHTGPEERFQITSPIGAATTFALRAAGRIFLGEPATPAPEVINLLGNAPAASDAFLATNGAWPGLYQEPAARGRGAIGRVRVTVFGPRARRWKLQGLRWVFDPTVPATSELPRFSSGARIADTKLRLNAQHPHTIAGLQLLQLRLWMLGYYDGAVDGEWRTMSVAALDRFAVENADLMMARDQRTGTREFADIYRRIDEHGWGIVNLGRVLTLLVDEFDAPAEQLSSATLDRLAVRMVEGVQTEEEWQEIEVAYADHRARERESVAAPAVGADGFSVSKPGNRERRRYFGWRRFFAAAGAFLRRVGGAIIRAARILVDALKSGFGQAFEVLRYLWRKVRVAVRIARLATRRLLCWLAGTPLGTAQDGHFAVTRWSTDFDTLQVISAGCPPEVRLRHAQRIHWMSTSLLFMSRLALLVLGLATAAALTWLLVAYRVYQFVRDLLRDERLRGVFSDDLLERGII